jgi:lysine 2,3-aminomutase
MTRARADVGRRGVLSRLPGLEERLAGVGDPEECRRLFHGMLAELGAGCASLRFHRARRVLETITGRWAEELTGVPVMGTLAALADGRAEGVSPGFLFELDGLLSSLVELEEVGGPPGGEAASLFLTRYPAGTDRDVFRRRHKNRVRILNRLGGSPSQWDDWIWQTRNTVRDRALLTELVPLSDGEKAGLDAAEAAGVKLSVTPYYLSLFDEEPGRLFDRALRNRVLPPATAVKATDDGGEPGGAPLLVERLSPFSALVKPCLASPQYSCYEPPTPELDVTDSKLRSALEWFGDNPDIWEAVIGGGDVLCLTDSKVEGILAGLSRYKHLRRILIRSNFPVVMPQRFTSLATKIISRHVKPAQLEVGLLARFCHPYEVTPEAVTVITRLRKAGVSVYNEALYTADNMRRFEFAALRWALQGARIETSYSRLRTGALKSGVPLARVLQELREEASLFPTQENAQVPVLETAGGETVPLWGDRELVSIRPDDGRRVYLYRTAGGTVLDTDTALSEFLEGMRDRGEDPADYAGLRGYV